jgi:hypothetical protein
MTDFTQEWHVMRRARRAFLLVAAVSGGVTWWATSTYYESHYRQRLEAAETRRELAQDELRRVQEGALQVPGCTIKKDSEEHFVRTLSSSGSPVVTLIPTEGDARSRLLTTVLFRLFTRSGWQVTETTFASPPREDTVPGVTIATSDNNIPRSALSLQDLLTEHNIEARIVPEVRLVPPSFPPTPPSEVFTVLVWCG